MIKLTGNKHCHLVNEGGSHPFSTFILIPCLVHFLIFFPRSRRRVLSPCPVAILAWATPSSTLSVIMSALRRFFLQTSDTLSLPRLVLYTGCWRVCQWFLMACICAVFPSHDPGDDVVRFTLRTEDDCFARVNTFCECGYDCQWPEPSSASLDALGACHDDTASTTTADDDVGRSLLQTHLYPFLLRPLTRWDAARFLRLTLRPQSWYPHPHAGESSSSETAHAFFPFFPAVVQRVARVLVMTASSSSLLPATCEGVLVLAAWICNTICTLIALVSLYQTTYWMLQRGGDGNDARACRRHANLVGLLFLCNPASVFFNTAYSEALFAALVFGGTYLLTRFGALGALVPWSLATATRSNGILYVGYMLLLGAGRWLSFEKTLWVRIRDFCVCLVVGDYILYPIDRHNRNAIARHCEDDDTSARFEWCEEANNNRFFYLYSYIQRKHWNVGFLRYYQWKQIPNFLLAAPILTLSSVAVAGWIQHSWRRVTSADQKPWMQQAQTWVVESLRQFASHESSCTESGVPLALRRSLLGHYAVLAVAAVLGLTTAHVQITTRLLCSTCPAIYWYAAHLVTHSEKWGSLYLAYCFLYIGLGTILHPLWLPWT